MLLSGLLPYWRLGILTRTTTTAAGRCSGRILASSLSLLLLLLVVRLAGWLSRVERPARRKEKERERKREGGSEIEGRGLSQNVSSTTLGR